MFYELFESLMNLSDAQRRSFLAFSSGYNPEAIEDMFNKWKGFYGVQD